MYGTLMRGFGNNRLLEGQRFVCTARTVERYAMFQSGIPFVHPVDPRTKIVGELWEVVSADAMRKLDQLEGHPDWYKRTTIQVELEAGQQPTAGGGPPQPVIQSAEIYFNSLVSDRPGERIEISDATEIKSGNFHDGQHRY